MSNDQTTPGVKIRQLNESDILSAMAALRVIIEIGVSRGVDMSDDAESLARLEETFEVGGYSPVVGSTQMQ